MGVRFSPSALIFIDTFNDSYVDNRLIDVGGTPTNILKSRKYEIALSEGIQNNKLVALLDPFDLSRKERTYYNKKDKIKLPIGLCKEINLSSDSIIPNIRKLMNNQISKKYPKLKTVLLEEVLKDNKEIIIELMKDIIIPVRAICPSCNKFIKINLGNKLNCCDINSEKIIDSGRYIPQSGFFSVILYLCGYTTYSNNKNKLVKCKEIMSKLGLSGKPIKTFNDSINEQRSVRGLK